MHIAFTVGLFFKFQMSWSTENTDLFKFYSAGNDIKLALCFLHGETDMIQFLQTNNVDRDQAALV